MLYKRLSTRVNIVTPSPFVLLIDDDADDTQMLSAYLKQHGINTKSFDSGENALFYLNLISENEQLPSLIILDYNMPGVNGEQVLSIIKVTLLIKHIPVIVYSTYISNDRKNALLNLGAYECVTKAETQKNFTKHLNRFKELAYLFHSKDELLLNPLKTMSMKPLNRKVLLNTMIKHETLTLEDISKYENLGLIPDKVHLRYLLKELVNDGYLTTLDGAFTPTYTITDKGIEEGKRLQEEEKIQAK